MTREELEKAAIGIDTGYRDMNGVHIKIGDSIVYYKKCSLYVGEDEVKTYPEWQVYGTGVQGYVYSGRVKRKFVTVSFDMENGFDIVPGLYAYLRERDKDGNLMTVLVCDREHAPKYTLEQILGLEPKEG